LSIGKLIGRGRVAEVYAWGDRDVLKLFFEGYATENVAQEVAAARVVHAVGLPTPAVGEVISFNNRHGIIFERLYGPSMLAEMSAKPWKVLHFARLLADLQVAINSHTASGLPSQRLKLQQSINSVSTLPVERRYAALRAVQDLPEANALCHGDFHPGNVVMSQSGAMIIDWTTATSGDPLVDVARTSLLLRLGELPPGIPLITRVLVTIGRKLFHAAYMRRYSKLRPATRRVIAAAQLPVAASRLAAGIPGERSKLLQIIQSPA